MSKIVYNVDKSRGIYVKMGKQVGNKKKKSDKSLFKYVPVYPKAPMDMKYHYYDDGVLKVNPNLFELVTDLGRLEEIFKGWEGKKVAIDTETTGLTFFKDFMVGFSVAVDKDFGIYVPLRHQIKRVDEVEEDLVDENGNVLYTKRGKKRTKKVKHETFFEHPANVDVKGALDLLWDLMKKSPLCIFFNLEFDATMFKNEGYDIVKEENIKLFDASILTYLFDAENKNWNNLKACSEIVLGRKPTKFEEALGGESNFRYVDLNQGYPYAGADACFDKDTEVLTRDGWVLWENYDGVTPLATPNLETNCMEWQTPTRLIKYKYTGYMKHAHTRNQDWRVTPNHTMLVHTAQDPNKPVLRKQADSLNVYETMYTGPKFTQNKSKTYQVGEYTLSEVELARLTAMVLADGYTSHPKKSNHQRKMVGVTIATCKNWEILKGFLDSLPFPNAAYYKGTSSEKTYTWYLSNIPLWQLLQESCGAGSRNKFVPQFIKDMSAEGIKEFITFYRYCDGSIKGRDPNNPGAVEICTTSTRMKDDIQELLTTIGINSCSRQRPPKDSYIKGRRIKRENCAPQWLIYFKHTKSIAIRQTQVTDEYYDDYVYCAEVPNHTLVTRRNGRVLVAGNCNTIGIYEQLGPKVRELLAKTKPIVIDGATKPYSVYHRDNELIQAFTDYYHHVDLCVDTEAAKRYKAKAEKELADAENKIYEYFDMGNFNLSPSSKAFQDAMKAKNIDTGLLTDTGNVSYGKKGIEVMSRKLRAVKEILRGFKYIEFDGNKLNKRASLNDFKLIEFITSYGKDVFKFKESTNYLLNLRTIEGVKMDKRELFEELKLLYKRENKKLEILKTIQKRSSLAKAVNSYIEKLTQVDTCHMHYNLKGTASGRLSSGNGSKTDKKKNHYFIDLNAQNLTKPHSAFYKAYRSDEEGNILGWKFEMVTEEYMHEHKDTEIIVEGSDPENNIRNCIVAPAGRYIASLDYSAQEYRAVAILSKDHKMLDNFKRGVDPHTATAYAIWGEENYDRQKRKKAKACVGEGTYLLTSNGYKTGDELDVEKDMLIDFNGEPQNWAKTVEDRELVRVTYDNGVVETYTPDHKVRVWNGREITWKQVRKLTKEDNIVQYTGLYNAGNDEPVIRDYSHVSATESTTTSFNINCKEFAYLAGIYLGDGTLLKYSPDKGSSAGQPRGITLCIEPEMLDNVQKYLRVLGLNHSAPEAIGKNKKVYRINCTNRAFANLIEDILGSTEHKHLDGCFRTIWTKETWSYFLAGLIDTDGFTRDGRTEFSSTLQEIIDAAVMACSIVGAKCHLEKVTTKYKGEPYECHILVLYDIPDLPQLVSRKMIRGKVSRQGGWDISKEDAEFWRSKYTEWGDNYRSKYYTTFNNVIKNGAKLVGSTLKVIRSKISDFPIQPNMACVHVVKKEKIHSGKTFIIQTSNHLYSTLGAGNANCNFLMNYCGGPTTLAENLDIPLEEAKDIISNYEKAFFECINWKKKIQKFVIEKNDGVAFSIFGRPRQFKSVLSTSFRLKSGTKEFQSIPEKDRIYKGDAIYKAVERKIVSHAVQSCCGDICRWDLIRLYRKFFKNRDPHIDFYTTVHDEINFTIDKDCVVDYVREIDDIMTIHNLSKELPIETSIDLGYTLGVLFPFEWEDETKTNLVPARV